MGALAFFLIVLGAGAWLSGGLFAMAVYWGDNAIVAGVVLSGVMIVIGRLLYLYVEALLKEKISTSADSEDTITVRSYWDFNADVSDVDPEYVDVKGLALELSKRELQYLLEHSKISADDFNQEVVRE